MNAGSGRVLDLLPLEARKGMGHDQDASVTTCTFYEGQAPVQYIKDKVSAIVATNPWVAGRLRAVNGKVALCIPSHLSDSPA